MGMSISSSRDRRHVRRFYSILVSPSQRNAMKLISSVLLLFMFLSCEQLRSSRSYVTQKRECAEAGRKWFDRRKQQTASNVMFDEPQFAYNRKLDTCLCFYETMLVTDNERSNVAFVIDVLSNKTLLTFDTVNGKVMSDSTPKFSELKRELMDADH
jgi:hypothetical protein